jgi:hypothetical protein
MFLGVFRRGRKPESSHTLSLNTGALKKLVAVSDEYWVALYEPIMVVAVRCFKCFKNNQVGLANDYIVQLSNAVRRSKGEVREDQLISHVYTYGLVLSFTSLYLSRLLAAYDFVLQYGTGNREGERREFYPWLSLPSSDASIKVRRKRHVDPLFALALPLYRVLVTDIAATWLQANSDINIAVLQAMHSNGEQGLYSVPLSYIKAYSFDSEQVEKPDITIATNGVVGSSPLPVSGEQAIDSLLDSFGVDLANTTLEDLFSTPTAPQPKVDEQVISTKQDNSSLVSVAHNKEEAVDEVDEFAALLAGGNSEGVTLSAPSTEPEVTSEIDEFAALLAGENTEGVALSAASTEPEVTSEIDEFSALLAGGNVETGSVTISAGQSVRSEPEIDVPVVEHISDELIEWAISSRNRSQGVFGVQIEGAKLLALQVPEAFYDYIDSEYSIESTQRDLVLEQLKHDLELSGNVISNVGDSSTFPVYVNGIEVNALIINQVFPRAAVGEVCINKEPA